MISARCVPWLTCPAMPCVLPTAIAWRRTSGSPAASRAAASFAARALARAAVCVSAKSGGNSRRTVSSALSNVGMKSIRTPGATSRNATAVRATIASVASQGCRRRPPSVAL